jgi:dTDP-glucose 4,6-dehydratase
LDVHFAIGNFIRDGLNGGSLIIQGDGTPYRSYLYAADLAIWLWTILLRGESCRPYNVGSDEAFTIEEVARLVGEQFKSRIEVTILGAHDPAKAPERYIPSIARARAELGLNVWLPLREAIAHTIHFHKGFQS